MSAVSQNRAPVESQNKTPMYNRNEQSVDDQNEMSEEYESCNNVHYLGIALIVVSLLLLLCWLGKSNKYEGFIATGPRFTPLYNHGNHGNHGNHVSSFVHDNTTSHHDTLTPAHAVHVNDNVRKYADSTVLSKWASVSSTSDHQGFEVAPDSVLDPNSGATIQKMDTPPSSLPPSVPLSDGVITPGMVSATPECASLTKTIFNLTEAQIDSGLPYYSDWVNRSHITT